MPVIRGPSASNFQQHHSFTLSYNISYGAEEAIAQAAANQAHYGGPVMIQTRGSVARKLNTDDRAVFTRTFTESDALLRLSFVGSCHAPAPVRVSPVAGGLSLRGAF